MLTLQSTFCYQYLNTPYKILYFNILRIAFKMRVAYSCFVDGQPNFEWQAYLLTVSLILNADVKPTDIKIHHSPNVSAHFKSVLDDCGVVRVEVSPFDTENPYCNKIMQTQTDAFKDYDIVILCDCDKYFLKPFSIELEGLAAKGRIVDKLNPPTDILEKLYKACGLAQPDCLTVGIPTSSDEITFSNNWNGGLYIIDGNNFRVLGDTWYKIAKELNDNSPVELGIYHKHIDQIAFGMALVKLKLPYGQLDEHFNVPTHLAKSTMSSLSNTPISLHYHDRQDHLGRLLSSQDSAIELAISNANKQILESVGNKMISDPAFQSLFKNWQMYKSNAADCEMKNTQISFRNPRYLRHSSRRLEHLASLQLDLDNKTVLELGAGIGEHSQFFLDRGCSVFSIEPRDINTAEIWRRHSDPLEFISEKNHSAFRMTADEAVRLLENTHFQIIYNYGLLYHISNPLELLRKSAELCEGIYLLETAVSDLIDTPEFYAENSKEPTNAIDQDCKLVSRKEIYSALKEVLPYVYLPRRQPAHEQFINDWTQKKGANLTRHRAVFIGSVTPLNNSLLSSEFLMHHE